MEKTHEIIMDIHGRVCRIEEKMVTREQVDQAIEKHSVSCKAIETKITPSTIRIIKKAGWYLVIGVGMGLMWLLGLLGFNIPKPPV